MKACTFTKKIASVLLVIVLMVKNFATAQTTEFLTRSKKTDSKEARQGKKMNPKMLQMKKTVQMPQVIPSATNLTKHLPHKNATRTPLAVTESGATLFGNLIYSNIMLDYSSIGYYSIDPNTGEYLPVGLNEQLAGAGTVVDGIAYVSYAETYWGMILGLYTVVYDIEEGEVLETVEHDPSNYGYYATNMAYNYADDMIYALTYSEDGSLYTLSKFDRESYTYTKISNVLITSDIFAMAFDNNGTLYVICADGKVYEMDPSTGTAVREICDTGFLPAYMQSAVWSPKDKKIIWAASNDTESYILAIDVNAGTTETLCTFNEAEEWVSLYTTDPMASEDAPAAPVIQYSITTPGSLLGSITVASPTLNIAGNELASTEYTLVIELNGTEIYNSLVTPGNEVSLNEVTFIEGKNSIRSYAINEAGEGAIASKSIYAGNDTPLPVTNLEVNINDAGQATLSWTAPTGGENNGYIDFSSLTYTVQRLGETIASGVTETTYVDQLPNEMNQYEWAVYAVFGDKVSQAALSSKVIYGDAITLPYEHVFNNAECLNLYTIVNANGDSRTWEYDNSRGALLYAYSSSDNADDYAITPPLQISNATTILVEVNACSYMLQYPETIEITLGTSTDPSTHNVILPATQLDWDTPQVLRTYATIDEPGDYYIGIHAVSQYDMYYLLVTDIKVSEGPNLNTPKAVQNVLATPGDNGALTTTITFTAPTETFNGVALTEDITVTAYRNDEVVGTTTCTPGGTGVIVDNNATNGFNKYVLVTSNSAGDGEKYEITCRCGVDTPSPVNNIEFTTAEDNFTTVISWDAPTVGAEGGYIDPANLTYTIYVPTADGYNAEAIDETTELFYEFTATDNTLQGYSFYISAKNEVGESDLYGGSVVLGKPYIIPFAEKIEETTLVNSPWYTSSEYQESSYASWELGPTMENYNLPEIVTAPDGGMAICYDFFEFGDGGCSLLVPKMSLVGADAPTLYFAMYHYTTAADLNEFAISITTDDASYEEIFAKKVNDATENGWVEYQVNLNEYKDTSWIGLKLDARISANGFVFLDYIIVDNAHGNDVMVNSVEAPKKATIGEEVEITAEVANKGSNSASFDITFFIDDKEIATVTETELAANDSKSYTAKFTPVTEDLGQVIIKAVVNMTGATDEVPANNEFTAEMTITQPYLRVVTDLESSETGYVATLTWSEPILAAEPIVDDMESYESWIVDNIGDYTIVDVDNTETYGITGYENQPLANGPKAWQVWTPAELGITTESWLAYEGEKCLVAFSTITGQADDWLISPEVKGGTEFSFWASIPTNEYGAEQFEVLYSTTDTNTESFQLIAQETKNTVNWQQYTYTLPEDAKYFAIRYISTDIFALLIDNISYVDPSNSSNTSDLTILGYNIYCDGQKVNDAVITETTYNYELPEACISYSLNVTVVYNEGESLFSNTVTAGSLGIEDINSLGINIYGQDSYIKIENVAGRIVNVYTIDGKVVYRAKAVDSNILIPANLGVYIVNIDNQASCKVLVR